MEDILNNREAAILIWFGVALTFVAKKTDLRKTLSPVLKCLLSRVILSVLFLFLLYVGFMIFCLESWSLWDSRQVKNTIIWTSVVGLAALFKVVGAERKTFFKNWISDNFKIAVIIGFIVSFYTFHILIELILQPFIVIIVMMCTFSENKEEHKTVNTLCNWILTIIGLYIIWWSGNKIWEDPTEFWTSQTAQDFATPIILSLSFTPFLYALYVYATYERIFTGLMWAFKDEKLRNYAKLRALLSFRLDLDFLDRWRRNVQHARPETKEDVKQSIQALKDLKAYEKKPLAVDPSDGWSPYDARKFLEEHGIVTQDYFSLNNEDWHAEAYLLEIGEQIIMNDNITYRIEGNKHAAKRLKLWMNVNNPDDVSNSEQFFKDIAFKLYKKAVSVDIPQAFEALLNDDRGVFSPNNYLQVELQKEVWEGGIRGGYTKKIIFEISR